MEETSRDMDMDQNFETLPEEVEWMSPIALDVYDAYTPIVEVSSRKLALAKIMITKLTKDVKVLSDGVVKDTAMEKMEYFKIKKSLQDEQVDRALADEKYDRLERERDTLANELEAEKERTKAALASSSAEDVEKEKSTRKVIDELERKVNDELRHNRDALEQEIKQLDERRGKLTTIISSLEARSASLEREVQDRKDTLGAVSGGDDDHNATEEWLEEDLGKLRGERKKLEEDLAASQAALSKEKKEVAAWKLQFDAKEKELDAYIAEKPTSTGKVTSTGCYKAIDDLLTGNDKLLDGVVQGMIQIQKQLEDARLDAGHGSCTNEAHKKEVGQLKATIKTLQGRLAKANADLKACQGKSATTTDASSRKGIADLLTTVDGLNSNIKTLQDALKATQDQTSTAATEGMDQQRITDLQAAVDVSEQAVAKLGHELVTAQAKLDNDAESKGGSVGEVTGSSYRLKLEVDISTRKFNTEQQKLQVARKALADAEQDINDRKSKSASAENKVQALESQIRTLEKQLSEVTKSRDNTTNYVRSEQESRKKLTERLTACQLELEIAEADRDKTHERLNKCEKAKELLKKSSIKSKQQIEELEEKISSKRGRRDDDGGDERSSKRPRRAVSMERRDQDNDESAESDESDAGDASDQSEEEEEEEEEEKEEFIDKDDDYVIPEAAEYPFKPAKVFPLAKDLEDEIVEVNELKKACLEDVKTLDDPKIPEPILDQLRRKYQAGDDFNRHRLKTVAHSRAMHEERHVFDLERVLERLIARKTPKPAQPIPTEQTESPRFNLQKRYDWVMKEHDRVQLLTMILARQERTLKRQIGAKTIREIKFWFESVFPAMQARNKNGDLKPTKFFLMDLEKFTAREAKKLKGLRAELERLKKIGAQSSEDHEAGAFYLESEGSSAWEREELASLDNEGMSDSLEQDEMSSEGANEEEDPDYRPPRSGKRQRIDPALQQLQ